MRAIQHPAIRLVHPARRRMPANHEGRVGKAEPEPAREHRVVPVALAFREMHHVPRRLPVARGQPAVDLVGTGLVEVRGIHLQRRAIAELAEAHAPLLVVPRPAVARGVVERLPTGVEQRHIVSRRPEQLGQRGSCRANPPVLGRADHLVAGHADAHRPVQRRALQVPRDRTAGWPCPSTAASARRPRRSAATTTSGVSRRVSSGALRASPDHATSMPAARTASIAEASDGRSPPDRHVRQMAATSAGADVRPEVGQCRPVQGPGEGSNLRESEHSAQSLGQPGKLRGRRGLAARLSQCSALRDQDDGSRTAMAR